MPIPKVLGLVHSCGECPHYQYYSAGVFRCKVADQNVLDKETIAPFCPLANFPSAIIAGMEITIVGLRARDTQNTCGFGLALMTHVATKLRLNLDPGGMSITLVLNGGREVSLCFHHITGVEHLPLKILFVDGKGGEFELLPDLRQPILREEIVKDEKRSWREFNLSS